MFYYASKIIWFFLQPSSLILFFIISGFVLSLFWFQRLGRFLMMLGIAGYILFGFFPLANIFLIPLENRIPPSTSFSPDKPPKGIIVLGGALETVTSKARGLVVTNEAAERMSETVALALKYPSAKILFSGGDARLIYKSMTESTVAKRFFTSQGIDPARLIFENHARNTWENAKYTAALLKGENPKEWLLVTSAFHMARSLGCFRKVGFDAQPWPVDYRTRGWVDAWRFFDKPSNGLRRADRAIREWVGLLAYFFTGRTSAFLPK